MDTMVLVTGNTYPVKDQLRAMGGRWDPEAKGWRVPADKAAEAQALVNGAPKSEKKSGSYHPQKCRVCGAVAKRDARGYPTVRIYRSGECQDCYEERRMGY